MITSLDQLSAETRTAARTWLTGSVKALPADLRDGVRDELTDTLLHRLDEHSTPEDLAHLITEIGPLDPGRGDDTDSAPNDRRTGTWHGLPYDLRPPTGERIKSTLWNPAEPRLLSSKAFGAGWDLNFGALAVRLGLIEPDAEDEPFASTPERAYALGAALPVAAAAAVLAHYTVRGRSLPERLPSHWDITGAPDRTVPKQQAAATDIAVAVGAAVLATMAARPGRTRPARAGLQAAAALAGTGATAITVWRTGGDRRRTWAGPVTALAMLGATGATLLGLALAGRNAEQRRDLGVRKR